MKEQNTENVLDGSYRPMVAIMQKAAVLGWLTSLSFYPTLIHICANYRAQHKWNVLRFQIFSDIKSILGPLCSILFRKINVSILFITRMRQSPLVRYPSFGIFLCITLEICVACGCLCKRYRISWHAGVGLVFMKNGFIFLLCTKGERTICGNWSSGFNCDSRAFRPVGQRGAWRCSFFIYPFARKVFEIGKSRGGGGERHYPLNMQNFSKVSFKPKALWCRWSICI